MAAHRFTSAALAIAIATALAHPARAQSAADKAAAEALFDQGKKLVAAGKYAEACPKFAESNRLDSGIGTMLYLADCYERSGMTASAWGQFREVASIAAKNGDAREKVARERAARLEPKLSKMIVSAGADVADVRRDGESLAKGLWGTELPVDPGVHTITASAPGKKDWQTTVQVGANAASVTVTIPALEDKAAASTASTTASPEAAPTPAVAAAPATPAVSITTRDAPESPPSRGGTQRVLGIALGGAGLVGIGAGVYFALDAKSHLDASNGSGHCHDGNLCDSFGVQARSDAGNSAELSTIAFVAGGAALVGGAVLYLIAPRASTHVAIAPMAGPHHEGLVVRGAW